jgi:hypothetical protein
MKGGARENARRCCGSKGRGGGGGGWLGQLNFVIGSVLIKADAKNKVVSDLDVFALPAPKNKILACCKRVSPKMLAKPEGGQKHVPDGANCCPETTCHAQTRRLCFFPP